MVRGLYKYVIFVASLLSSLAAFSAQTEKLEVVALKNNLLYDAALTPNLELEIRLAPKWSMEVGAGFNPFPLDDTKFPKWRHVSAWIAPRYWFCNVFNRGFFSFNAAYAHYNVAGGKYPLGWMYKKVLDNRYQGDAVMAGVSFGWHFAISPHFSVELEAGADVGYTWYTEFECKHCGAQKAQEGSWFALPKVGVNLSVPLGGDKLSLAKRCDCELLDSKQDEQPDEGVVHQDTVPEEEEREQLLAARKLPMPLMSPARVEPYVPSFVVSGDSKYRLRNRLLRSEEEYEPYNPSMALSADPRNVFVYFDVDVAKMDRSFLQNDLLMDSIMNILGEAMEDTTIHISHVRIVGFASFDGRLSYNERLAGTRARTIKEYMQSIYPQLQDSVFAVCNGGESWADLKHGLQRVEFEGRDEVLQIIDSEPDYDAREKKIKALHGGTTYRYMRDELKYILRNLGCITIFYELND
jgi:outer membrane protein OmpA-like peptidoglycan-associated protein